MSVIDFIRECAHRVSMIPGVKKTMKPFWKIFNNIYYSTINARYRKNALKVLTIFDSCMNEVGVKYTIMFGTLLGAVRNKGFLKHDLDIDTAIWHDDYSCKICETLLNKGFRLKHKFVVEGGGGLEETYEYKGVSIDIFVMYPPIDEYPYFCLWEPVKECVTFSRSMSKYGYVIPKRIELPMGREVTYLPFETIKLPAPLNASELLKFSYGDDYMTPNTKWTPDPTNPYRKIWREKKAVYITC